MSKSEVKFKETIIGRIPEDFERGDDLVKAISEFLSKECFLLRKIKGVIKKVSDLFILLLPTAFDTVGSFCLWIFKVRGNRYAQIRS